MKCLLSCQPGITDAPATTIQGQCNLQYIIFKYSVCVYLIFSLTVFSKSYKTSAKERIKKKTKTEMNRSLIAELKIALDSFWSSKLFLGGCFKRVSFYIIRLFFTELTKIK